MKGLVKNFSYTKTLWVVETDSGVAIAHKLAPRKQSPASVDADGFKAVDGTPIDGHNSWWKIRSFSTADVKDSKDGLTADCFRKKVEENEFGPVSYDVVGQNWGSPLVDYGTSFTLPRGPKY